ncbi:hypothetical protein PhCBS80983_g06239 [Powellomyces hirtus]|uniref:U4/U6.U5 small nuclear ribonucleoprotein 27kDa protein domain-containing protein n=1 Tax=Powellomyces hirtus TaxID=109895 RepID=A0A507DPZ9_9FUNG|nr:hypothetical protein PhCBS80983_g06239 [Powellomyces hirtus]
MEEEEGIAMHGTETWTIHGNENGIGIVGNRTGAGWTEVTSGRAGGFIGASTRDLDHGPPRQERGADGHGVGRRGGEIEEGQVVIFDGAAAGKSAEIRTEAITTGGGAIRVATAGNVDEAGAAAAEVVADQEDDQQADMMEEMTEEEKMKALMGFAGFDTTQGKKVVGSDASGVAINKQRTYRQYMNRRRGFNRNLSPTR